MNEIFKALSDKSRRKVLELLKEKDMCVSELLEHFGFRQASLSHHLTILKNAWLINSERRGQYIYYKLNREPLKDVIAFFTNLYEEETPETSL